MVSEWLPISFPWELVPREPTILGAPVERVTVTRSLDLQLELHTEGKGSRADERDQPVPGTTALGHTLRLVTERSESVIAETAHITEERVHVERALTAEQEVSRTFLEGRAAKVTVAFLEGEANTVTEWLANVPERLWRITNGMTPVGRDYAEIKIGSDTLSHIEFGLVKREHIPDGQMVPTPGFLRFRAGPRGIPDENTRHTVRRSLEFLLGRALAVVGLSTTDANDRLISASVLTAYLAGGSGAALPPALLHEQELDSVDEIVVGEYVRSYLREAKAYNLNQVVWRFLHGRNAPLDMVAGYLGSAFEVLRRQYYSQPTNEARSRLLPPARWRTLLSGISQLLDQMSSEEEWRDAQLQLANIKSRLSTLNEISGTKLNLLFLDDLKLQHGEVEKQALLARNDAAHANILDTANNDRTLRQCRALHTLIARVIFSILNIEVEYFDYSSIGHVPRALTEKQGDQR